MPEGLNAVTSAVARVASKMTPRIQNHAIEHGWPKDVARRLSVTQSDGVLVAKYDGPMHEAMDQEFGTSKTAPKAAINNFFGSHKVRRDIRKSTLSSLDEVVVALNRLFS